MHDSDYQHPNITGGGAARYLTADGRAWYGKTATTAGSRVLVAEAIAWQFACAIGAPVPEGAYAETEEGNFWLSSEVQAAKHYEREFGSQIANLEEVGAMLALDAVLANPDRSDKNLLVTTTGEDAGFTLSAIDFGDAHVGDLNDSLLCGEDAPDITRHVLGLPIQALSQPVSEAAALISQLAINFAELAYINAAEVAGIEPELLACESLQGRCAEAEAICEVHLQNLEALA